MLSKNQILITRNAIESLYCDTCDIVIYEKYKKENNSTGFKETKLFENLKCKLSFDEVAVANIDNVSSISQDIKVFLPPDINILAGSKLIITHNGKTKEYISSGEPAIYFTHQEIKLKLNERWA